MLDFLKNLFEIGMIPFALHELANVINAWANLIDSWNQRK